jgi:thymidylate synthase (FAD)
MEGKILVELQAHMGSDREIAEAAWTSSFNKETREQKTDEQVALLVPRLIRDGHSTPIESVILRFWIRMPIFTDRQHMTHRIASHNGLSGRYRTMPLDWFPLPSDVNDIINKATFAGGGIQSSYEESCKLATENYRRAVESLKYAESRNFITNAEFKRAREVLRGQLPTAGMVERTTILNLRSFANYQKLRNSDHAQPEIREVARLMLQAVEESNVAPIAVKTLKEMGWKI